MNASLNNVSAHKMTLVLPATAKELDRNRVYVSSCKWQQNYTVVAWQQRVKSAKKKASHEKRLHFFLPPGDTYKNPKKAQLCDGSLFLPCSPARIDEVEF